MNILLKNINNNFSIFILSIALFIYLYAIVIIQVPIGLDKILFILSFLLVIPFNIKKFIFFTKENIILIKYFILLILLFTYNGLIFSINISDDSTLLYSLILRLTVFYFPIIFFLFYVKIKFKYIDYINFILKLLLFIISIQSFFVILSFINIDFKLYIDTILPYIGHIGADRMDRLRGISNSSGAALSIVQGIGAYISLLLLDKEKKVLKKILFLSLIVLNILAILFIGRTGLVLFVLCGGLYILFTLSLTTLKNIFYIVLGFVVLFYIIIHFKVFIDPKYINLFYNNILPWALELFTNIFINHTATTSSNQELWNMIHFPNSFKTFLFGDGIFERPYTLSDSGYVRYIYAMGLFGTILLLYPIVLLLYKIKSFKWKNRREFIWLILLSGFLIFIDIKEPFLLKPQVYPLFLILLFTFIMEYNERKKYILCKK